MATYGQLIQLGPYFSGGLLCTIRCYHFIVGTTTLKDVYIDREKGSTAAQPVASDANGIVSFYADGIYKFRIDGATDGSTYTTLYTYDKWAVVDLGTQTGEGAAIASAATLVLGTDGDFFHVTGSTGPITAMSGTQSHVTLVFDSTPTLTHSGNLILQDATNYTVSVGTAMVFVNEGAGAWRELSRTPTAYSIINAKGDLIVGTSNDNASPLTVGANGTIPMARSAVTLGMSYVAAMNKAIYGLTYDNGTDATNDININTGGCMDATGAYWMTLGTALGKQSDNAWAVGGTTGTPLGWLDTGTVGSNDYYIWLIARSDTGVVDSICSLSSTAPSMPANYDFKRLIGWFKRVGGTVVAFHTYEVAGGSLEFNWDVPTLDVDLAATLSTARRTDAVKVPLNFSVMAMLRLIADDGVILLILVCCPDETDAAPSSSAAPAGNLKSHVAGVVAVNEAMVRTSAAGLVAGRAQANTIDQYRIVTKGFVWGRRN